MIPRFVIVSALLFLFPRQFAVADVVTDWNSTALDAIRVSNTPPPAAARNLAILHASIYDSVNGIRGTYKPYFVTMAGPPGASIEAAAAAASYRVLINLYANLQGQFQSQYEQSVSRIPDWDCKYTFNLWRPITAIQEADTDGNEATKPDWNWMPLLETPPFPEYSSGHSTFSGAAAVVLASFFGSDRIRFSVGSDDLPGVFRSYKSFSEAALESGLSRIYGGIHFMSANLNGLSTGAETGVYVVRNFLTP